MKLCDIFKGEFIDWDANELLIEPRGDIEIFDKIIRETNAACWEAYDDFQKAVRGDENDTRVINQYDINYPGFFDLFPDGFIDWNAHVDEPEIAIEIDNDLRVIAQWDEKYFESLEWAKFLNYLTAVGLDKSQIERRLKLNKIRKIMKEKYLITRIYYNNISKGGYL